MINASLLPTISYATIQKGMERKENNFLGRYRFIGALEAIQQNDIIWIRDKQVSLSVEMRSLNLYLLPSESEESQDMLMHLSWKQISSLTEGTSLFVSGNVYKEKGHAVFRDDKKEPLTVVIFDGSPYTLMQRAIRHGRQRNEYWNQFTAGALSAGTISLLILTTILFRALAYNIAATISLSLSLLPIIPLFPPGVVFFFLYRHIWAKALELRVERDLLLLPLRYFPEFGTHKKIDPSEFLFVKKKLPDGETYAVRVFSPEMNENSFDNLHNGEKILKELKDKRNEKKASPYFGFGKAEHTNVLQRPIDPLADYITIPGNPLYLSNRCNMKAHFNELLAALFFFVDFCINYFIVFLLLQALTRR